MTADWPDTTSRELQSRLVEWIRKVPAGFERLAPDLPGCYGLSTADGIALEKQFQELALELFAYQFERLPLYRNWCRQIGRLPTTVQAAHQIPALPVEAFRDQSLHSFPAEAAIAHYRTSGTSSTNTGTLVLDDLTLYETSLLRSFEHHVLPDRCRMRMLQLIPTAGAAPHSSLAHMISCVRARWGTAQSACFVEADTLKVQQLHKALQQCVAAEEPVLLLGTALAWMTFLDACRASGWQLQLPVGSRLFETGGYKGRRRVLTREQLLQGIEDHLGIAASYVVSEYGMTEMGSQYYTLRLRSALLSQTLPSATTWSFPAWLRPRLLHSEDALPSAPEEATTTSLLLHHDLANRGSVSHLMTADLGTPHGASFELVGRAPVADLRGCGLSQESQSAGQVA